MRQIIYVLAGDDSAPPLLDRHVERFVQRLRDDIEDVIWHANFRGSSLGRELYKLYVALKRHARTQFFLSPDGFEAIYAAWRRGSDDDLLKLIECIKRDNKKPLWSAEQSLDNKNTPDRFLLGETITVDLGSKLCQRRDPTSPVFFLPYEKPSPDEAEKIREKLYAAFLEIETYAPCFARMIRNYTRTIYARKAGDLMPSSEQVDTELGAIRLRNTHADIYTHDQLVDALIHESTHNLLGTFEYLNFPFIPVGNSPSPKVRPVSPWSMRPIQVLPFLHAAFVYFAMFNYAQKRLSQGIKDNKTRQRFLARRNQYASGFLMPGKLSDDVSSLAQIDPRVGQAIDWVQNIVRTQMHAGHTKTEHSHIIMECVA